MTSFTINWTHILAALVGVGGILGLLMFFVFVFLVIYTLAKGKKTGAAAKTVASDTAESVPSDSVLNTTKKTASPATSAAASTDAGDPALNAVAKLQQDAAQHEMAAKANKELLGKIGKAALAGAEGETVKTA